VRLSASGIMIKNYKSSQSAPRISSIAPPRQIELRTSSAHLHEYDKSTPQHDQLNTRKLPLRSRRRLAASGRSLTFRDKHPRVTTHFQDPDECVAPETYLLPLHTQTSHLDNIEHDKSVMLIRATDTLHYPITVTKLLVQPDDAVEKYQTLFNYRWTGRVVEGNRYGDVEEVEKEFPAEFKSETSGTLVSWHIKEGDVLRRPG
jgi:hypothetical protein